MSLLIRFPPPLLLLLLMLPGFLHVRTWHGVSAAPTTPNYGNPFAHGGKCGSLQSKIKLKISGSPHKVCAPKCSPLQSGSGSDAGMWSCPTAPQAKANTGTCISVSNLHLCVPPHPYQTLAWRLSLAKRGLNNEFKIINLCKPFFESTEL